MTQSCADCLAGNMLTKFFEGGTYRFYVSPAIKQAAPHCSGMMPFQMNLQLKRSNITSYFVEDLP